MKSEITDKENIAPIHSPRLAEYHCFPLKYLSGSAPVLCSTPVLSAILSPGTRLTRLCSPLKMHIKKKRDKQS